MNLLGVVLVTDTGVTAGIGLCHWLHYHCREVGLTVWVLEHIICPIVRILILFIVVSQIYPAIDNQLSSFDFWEILLRQGQFNQLLNILFFGGLLLAFIPLVSHPVFTLPIQSMLTIALVFRWQYADFTGTLQLFPSMATILKMTGYMIFAYLVTRQSSIKLSRWVDRKLAVSGSIRPLADAVYLVLQIPIMLIYCSYLKLQLS